MAGNPDGPQSRREQLVKAMADACAGVVSGDVRFDNDDVPRFLARLAVFKEKSRAAHLLVK